MDENRISKQVIGVALEVHQALGPGLLESAYQACLAREMSLQGLVFRQQATIDAEYKGLLVESAYRADFLINDRVIVELKTVDNLLTVHRAQLLTYLKWGGYKLGLLFNFNSMLLKQGIQRVVNNL
ncbi:MAG: GxxExxY protein [Candidatus Thiodiazotropha sp. (ex Ctena orbiculata)]|nr:GxxExxY protein [Candidatus Thiodiazotropha taylori]MBT2995256.1 GxxExxY protein [Candidatus Thiodiazotropha taylori]MBT2999825.1 GxxExxY protein [Candidatus Thiodiazotropha taylori]MBV2105724.1 GxxExxY protein [Candidatus Thiodiazotropha taylori]MBV2109512.1 GxxExxY protein [Candidatus Thiodiazotropha taylori]